jgi:hypothetical protein
MSLIDRFFPDKKKKEKQKVETSKSESSNYLDIAEFISNNNYHNDSCSSDSSDSGSCGD